MPATAMMALASLRTSRCGSSRWRPATPQSNTRSTRLPIASAVTAASSATGRSEVPALTTTISPTPSRASRLDHDEARGLVHLTHGSPRERAATHRGLGARGEHVVVRLGQPPDDRHHLLRRLALAEDGLGHAGRSAR